MRLRRRKSYDAFGREISKPKKKARSQRPSLHEVAMRGGMRGITPPSGRPTKPPPKPAYLSGGKSISFLPTNVTGDMASGGLPPANPHLTPFEMPEGEEI